MSLTRTLRPLLLALYPLALLGAGCNNNPYPDGESTTNTLYRVIGSDPKSLDPSFVYGADDGTITDLIFPSFYKYHYLKRQPLQLVLNIGAREPTMTKVSVMVPDADGSVRQVTGERYTFTLRSDLHFQDDVCFRGGKGRPVTARDMVYAFKRMADPRVHSPFAPNLADKVLGWQEYSDRFLATGAGAGNANYDREMPGIQVDAKDPLTFHLTLTQPYPQLRYLMAMHFTTPQAREAVETYGDEIGHHPVGCGPYRLSNYQIRQRIVLTPNPNRFAATYPTEGDPGDREAGLLDDAGKTLPLAGKIVFNIIAEPPPAWNLFLQGYLDASAVNNDNYQQAISAGGTLSPELARRGVVLKKEPTTNVYYMSFNMQDPVWGGYSEKHRKLRQAISLAVDAEDYINLLLQGNATPAEWIISPSVFGYDPKYRNPYRRFSLEKAKQLLAEAGYPGGVDPATGQKLVLHYDNAAITPAGRTQTGIITRMIERLGIKLESRTSTPGVFSDKLQKNQHQFILYGWGADYPDPENFAFLLYGPNRIPGPNVTNYQNAEFDRLFERMRTMEDSPERTALIARMRDVAVRDCPVIPVYHRATISLAYDWLKNVKAHPTAGDFNQYRRVDFETRARKQHSWNRPNPMPLVAVGGLWMFATVPAIGVVRRHINRRVRVSP